MKLKTHQLRIDDLTARFDALLSLEDGWLDGKGMAPNKTELVFIARKMAAHYPKRLPLPAIVPTPEGNLLIEWDLSGNPSVDFDLGSSRAAFHAFQPDETETEREFLLKSDVAWNRFFDFLNEDIQRREA
jgi:hypothetical protein